MKSLCEWRLANSDPDWEKVKSTWGGGKKTLDPNLVNKMRVKIEGIKEWFVRELGEPKITSFRDVPPNMRDSLAQAIVAATMKVFYTEGGDVPGMATIDQTKSQQPNVPAPQPQNQTSAPAGWKG
jgi:hypothetical protein